MENKFTIKDMNLYYGSFHALKGVNLNLPANEVTAFIGPSGCGKSTLLRSLNRMNDLVEGCKITGDIRLDNEDIYGSMDINLLRKRVGMVFQKANPFPMSIYDNIAYGPRTHGIRSKSKLNEIVEKSLRDAAIWDEVKDRLNKSALGMSGGQQQRVALARIFLSEPDILMLDEPFSALDEYLRWNLEQELLEVLRQFSGPALFVSHSRDEIYRICGKACVMDQGTSSPVISVRQLFEAPESKAAAVLSGCKNFARAQLAEADVKKTVYVRDWGEYLTCTGTKAGEICYVGVRSHYIYPVSETEAKTHPDNTFRCRIEKVIDDVFSTVIMVMPEHAEQSEESCRNHFNRIRVETTKEFWRTFCEKEHPQESLWLHVDPADVMVLR